MATDLLASAALTALDGAIGAISLPPAPAGLSRQLRVLPDAIRARGLGGYIGEHPAPRGPVRSRVVRAVLEVRVSGGQDAAAATHLGSVVRTLLTQREADLRGQGIERLALRPQPDDADPRQARFDLSFEYRHLPTASEGVIETLDLGLDTNVTPYRARYRTDLATRVLAGAPQPLAQFAPANDTDLDPGSPPGAWSYSAPAQAIAQTAATRGGGLTADDPRKAGAQLLWRIGGAPLALARFIAVVEFESASAQGVGLVFGRTGANDRWHFLMSQASGYHLFGRKTGVGAWHTVGAPASAGFATGVRHTLAITVFDHTLRAALDGVQTLEVHSDDPVPAGEIGFFTHGNNGARFHRMRLLELV
jgi:hypothetical protein